MALTRERTRTTTSSSTDADRGEAGRSSGTGEGVAITVKGQRATAAQRATINACLAEGDRLGCSKRVLVAIVMAITQESGAGDPRYTRSGDAAGPDSRGPFHQRAPWGSLSDRMDPTSATRLFLTANQGAGVQGWKVVHGSLSVAPGGLSAAINAVQHSQFPNAYAQWQSEAEKTVEAFASDAGTGGGGDRRYEFTRGERGGERESSWDASGRLAEEVAFNRWAAGNVLYFVSDEELRRAAPSVTIRGDEPWMLTPTPQWDWGTGRAIAEMTIQVLTDEWGVMPGGVVVFASGAPWDGRWIVSGVSGSRLDSPVVDITLRRPTLIIAEPAAEASSGDSASSSEGDGGLFDACKAMDAENRGYLYGGGHGVPLSSIGADDPLDCSSSCSKVLKDAGMFPGSAPITSGVFATDWGAAGKGREFTVWANGTHVWIEFHSAPSGYRRFDTSPHGSGGRGPHLRTTARGDQGAFTARHWESR